MSLFFLILKSIVANYSYAILSQSTPSFIVLLPYIKLCVHFLAKCEYYLLIFSKLSIGKVLCDKKNSNLWSNFPKTNHIFRNDFNPFLTNNFNVFIFFSGNNLSTGLWLISGIIAFSCIERVFNQSFNNEEKESRKITGYLNLSANCIDNFIHGLAVASSFLSSFRLGLTTVFAILVHEIPHEVGDFIILMNSGFSR